MIFISKLMFNIKIKGIENFNSNQTYVIVSNHNSWLDPLLIFAALPGIKIATMAEGASALKAKWLQRLIKACRINIISVDRADQRSRIKGLKQSLKVIESGESFLIFPEGRLNKKDNKMYPFYQGAFLLAKKSDTNILPVYIRGSEELYFRRRINIEIGQPFNILKKDSLDSIAVKTYHLLNDIIKPKKPENNHNYKMFNITDLFLGEMADEVETDSVIIRGNKAKEVFGKVNEQNKKKYKSKY